MLASKSAVRCAGSTSRLTPIAPSLVSDALSRSEPAHRKLHVGRASLDPCARSLRRASAHLSLKSVSVRSTRTRAFATEAKFTDEQADDVFDLANVERAQDEADVVIVGAGPAGLSAAIRIKQRAENEGKEVRVVVLEKAAEMGAHILSGAVIETRSLEELFPNWKELGAPLHQMATKDKMRWLTSTSSYPMPHPPQMNNKGNYIVSLSKLVRWLGEQAEALGVEIYPGFAGSKLVLTEDKSGVAGVITNEVGLSKSYQPKDSFEPGMEFRAKATIFAEGCHGSLSKQLISRFNLRDGKDPQTYGLGIKEVWRVREEVHEPGTVVHTMGWPLDKATYGGSWLYHMENRMVSLGLVVGLDYANPYISPYREFQRMKHHPFFASLLEGGECLAYGARALNEGGYQSIPKLTVPGAALIGDSAGFLNVPKIKGTHTSMQSGILAADAVFDAVTDEAAASTEVADVSAFESKMSSSWVMDELKQVRNIRPSFHNRAGVYGGIVYAGLDTLLLRGKTPWTFHHPGPDYAATRPADQFKPIEYPAPDGKLSFDILTSVSRTGTNHAEDQPVHLVVKDGDFERHVKANAGPFAGLLNKACPAGVYEYIDTNDAGGEPHDGHTRLQINSQNCIHCKTCDIKVPTQDINWQPPEGGGGPSYDMT